MFLWFKLPRYTAAFCGVNYVHPFLMSYVGHRKRDERVRSEPNNRTGCAERGQRNSHRVVVDPLRRAYLQYVGFTLVAHSRNAGSSSCVIRVAQWQCFLAH